MKMNSSVISVKEARKILGKEVSDKLSDEDLVIIIGSLHGVVESLLDFTTKQSLE